MINNQLITPKSIAVVGGSSNLKKPGGKVLKNLIDGGFDGELYAVNPKEQAVQGITCFADVTDLPEVDLAIIAIPSHLCVDIVRTLAAEKNTKAFVLLSAGFAEASEHGRELEQQLVDVVNEFDACLIGPNCIGVINASYKGVFTTPIPKFEADGCDLISGSGATAVFIMEAGLPRGLRFANIFSVGNSAQVGVEDVLAYLDNTFDPDTSSHIKLLYIEHIADPQKFFKHTSSLIAKGCKIAAIKSGSSEAGSRAASSHTGALATSDVAVRALFAKAGVVYCSSRDELITVASIFTYKALEGRNVAVITHAGGSAVMLTDALCKGKLNVPPIEGKAADDLLSYLHPGSSVSNPIDFLATGTAEQLGIIIDYCEHKFEQIDAMIVVFGSSGLMDVENVYNVLNVKLDICKKPIFPVLPSLINARKEIDDLLSRGKVNFPDEVALGNALSEVTKAAILSKQEHKEVAIDTTTIRNVIDRLSESRYLSPTDVSTLLAAVHITQVPERIAPDELKAINAANELGYPLVMKVVGPVHKSDVGGVLLAINNEEAMLAGFQQLMKIDGAESVMLQQHLSGVELFAGVKYEDRFGHLVLCGLGGILVEVLHDFSTALAPVSVAEAETMITSLRGYPVIEGIRGKQGVSQKAFADIILRLSALVEAAPEISELDLNPMLATGDTITVVDARVRVDLR